MYTKEEKGIIELQFRAIQGKLKQDFEKAPDLDAILFLIGIQELGKVKKKFTKEQKQDLMHIAVCRMLSQDGYFRLTAYDNEGWPHYEATKKLPEIPAEDQEYLLKEKVVQYFEAVFSESEGR